MDKELSDLTNNCMQKHSSFEYAPDRKYCKTEFDNFICWPPTLGGTTTHQQCPEEQFNNTNKFTFRKCLTDGSWYDYDIKENAINSWTNYTPCYPSTQNVFSDITSSVDTQYKRRVEHVVRNMKIFGFCVSLVSLLISICIFKCYMVLQNRRTLVHQSLFTAMLLQVTFDFVHLINFFDTYHDPAGLSDVYSIAGNQIPCITLYSILEYLVTVTFMWMLMQGIHLYTMVVHVYRSDVPFWVYSAISWGSPVLLTLVWALATTHHFTDETIPTCWYRYKFIHLYYILQVPRLLIILVNGGILAKVLYVVYKKLNSVEQLPVERYKHTLGLLRKSVYAALILLPLLSITCGLNMLPISHEANLYYFAIWSVMTNFLRAFQGFFLALIYCFNNDEVRELFRRRLRQRRERLANRVRRHESENIELRDLE